MFSPDETKKIQAKSLQQWQAEQRDLQSRVIMDEAVFWPVGNGGYRRLSSQDVAFLRLNRISPA